MKRPELALLALAAGLGAFVIVQAARAPRPAAVAPPADSLGDSAALGTSDDGHVQTELRRTSTPPPARDVADIRRRIQLGASGTYIADVLKDADSLLTRWPERVDNPLRIWIDPAPAVAAWRPGYVTTVHQAFDEWSASGIPMRFTFIVDTAGADVRVTWADSLDQSRIGNTRRVYDQNGWIVSGQVIIATHAPSGAPLDSTLVRATALHEVGHLLGLPHSADSTTIMSPSASRLHELAPADRATLRLLYSLPPGSVK
jgi:hypothetical protein